VIVSVRGLDAQVPQYGLLKLTPRETSKGKKKADSLVVSIVLAQYRKTAKTDHLR